MSGGPFAPSIYSSKLVQAGDGLLKLAGALVNSRLFRSKARAVEVQVAAVKFYNLAVSTDRDLSKMRGTILQFMLQHPALVDEAHSILHRPEETAA